MDFTLEVSKLFKFKDDNEIQESNNPSIFITFDVSKLPKYISDNDEQ